MRYGLSVSTAPAAEPVSLAEAQTHLRVDSGIDDTYIETLITAARLVCESYTRRAFVTQTLKLSLDKFPDSDCTPVLFPRSPAQSITSITYLDENGDSQVWSSSEYTIDIESVVPRIIPAYGYSWPSTYPVANAVTILVLAGYGAASAVPMPIKHAIKLLVGTYYDPVRATVITGSIASRLPNAAEYLLGPYRVGTIGGNGV